MKIKIKKVEAFMATDYSLHETEEKAIKASISTEFENSIFGSDYHLESFKSALEENKEWILCMMGWKDDDE